MNDMVERVAQAICLADDGEEAWLHNETRERWLSLACAAIEAMRALTPHMRSELIDAVNDRLDYPEGWRNLEADYVWNCVIDATLEQLK